MSGNADQVAQRIGQTLFLNLRGFLRFDGEARDGFDADAVCTALLENRDASLVDVKLDSRGGSIKAGEQIFAALRAHPGSKVVTAARNCASAATLILLAGDVRVCARGTELFIHEVEQNLMASERHTAEKHAALAVELRRVNARLVMLYAERTGTDPEVFAEEMRNENLMPLERAIDIGLVDFIEGEEPWPAGEVGKWFGSNSSPALNGALAAKDGSPHSGANSLRSIDDKREG